MSKRAPGPVGLLVDQIGLTILARRFGHNNLTTVSSWKARNSIPVKYWPDVIDVAGKSGIQLDEARLVALHNTPEPEAA